MRVLTEARLEKTEARGREALATQPRAIAARYGGVIRHIMVDLIDGRIYGFPAELVPD